MGAQASRAVVITGIGVVSPFGVGREHFWQHISHGCSATRAITQFDASSYPCQVAAWVPPVTIEDALPLDGDDEHDGRADPKRYSRAALFGVLSIGGEYAARRAEMPNVFLLLLVGMVLLFMVVIHHLADRRSRGLPLVPGWPRPSAPEPGGSDA